MASFKRGDKVAWNTSQGPTRGTVVGRVEVRSDLSGKPAVHRPDALKKVR